MPKHSYLPSRQAELAAWEDNFIAKISEVVLAVGMPATAADEITAKVTAHQDTFAAMNEKKAEVAAASKKNEIQKDATLADLSEFIGLLKAQPNYTDDLGKMIGVVRPEGGEKNMENKPVLDLSMEGGVITIKFKKHGMTGIKIYSKRGTETEFSFLAIDTASPYNDTRPNLITGQPEKREYMAYYLDKDDQVGLPSDVISVFA
jgi:hypothetical protein